MSEYFDRAADKTFTRVYKAQTPDILEKFAAFDDAVFQAEGRAIPLKFRELIALAVGITTQCVYCIDAHSQNAVKAGATEAELAEAAWVATAIRAGGGFAHGRLAFKLGGASDAQDPAARHAATPPEHDATSHEHG
jgi:AhpD family alkylhydroperoxidase